MTGQINVARVSWLRPDWAVVTFKGVPHLMNRRLVREAAIDMEIAGGDAYTMTIAGTLGISRSTVSHFLSGRTVSLRTALKLLDHYKLKFDDVFTRLTPERLRTLQSYMVVKGKGNIITLLPEANKLLALPPTRDDI